MRPHHPPRSVSPRTFTLDPAGRLLVVANQTPLEISEGAAVKSIPASLAVFRIQPDGRLEFVRKLDTAPALFWTAIVPLP